MTALKTKQAMRDIYLDTVGNQLKMLHTEIEQLHRDSRHIKPTSRYAYFHELRDVEEWYHVVQKDFQDLSLAGPEKWQSLQTEIDKNFAVLQTKILNVRKLGYKLSHGSIGWTKGLAPDQMIDTTGWAEGQAEAADDVTSMGWAEGQAEEDLPDTAGWAEGQAKPKAA